MEHSAKLVAKVKLTLTKRNVDALKPEDKPWIAWDDKLTGFVGRQFPTSRRRAEMLHKPLITNGNWTSS